MNDEIEYDKPGQKSDWKFYLPIPFTENGLAHIADALEAGEITPGSFTIDIPINHGLSSRLIERLKPIARFTAKIVNS